VAEQIKVLAVDQNPEGLARLRQVLAFDDVQIVQEAAFGPVALTWARSLHPDVVLVAAEEPLARSLLTIELLTRGKPSWTVIAIAPRFEPESFRKVVLAGARDVVLRSSSGPELREAILNARRADVAGRSQTDERLAPAGTIVPVFGIKGGIGKTTLAVNLAIALAQETSRSVAIVDTDLPFGDLAVMLDVQPERNLLTALEPGVADDPERLQLQLTPGPSGIHVLPAPLNPDSSVVVSGAQVGKLVTQLASIYDFVVVDTPPGLSEGLAATLDAAPLGLMVTTPEVPCLRRTQACLRLLAGWGCSPDKIKLILNRSASKTGIKTDQVEEILEYPITWRVSNDHAALEGAASGMPAAVHRPRSSLAGDIRRVARDVAGLPAERSFFGRFWSPRPAMAASA
jgi:pilus assembly protein CpaE